MRGSWILCLAVAVPALGQIAWSPPPQTLVAMGRRCSACHVGNPKDRQFTEAGEKKLKQKAAMRAAAHRDPKQAEPMQPEAPARPGPGQNGGH